MSASKVWGIFFDLIIKNIAINWTSKNDSLKNSLIALHFLMPFSFEKFDPHLSESLITAQGSDYTLKNLWDE